MPQVPTKFRSDVEQDGGPANFITVQATPEHFGAARARALAELGGSIASSGDDLNKVAVRIRQEDEVRQTQSLAVDMENDLTDMLYGENGFYRLQGEDAVKASDDARERINNYVRTKAETVSDQGVKARFLKVAQERIRQEIEPMARHNIVQGRVSAGQLSEARQANALRAAITNRTDVEMVSEALNDGFDAIETHAEFTGEPDEVTEFKRRQFESAVHMKIIDSYGTDYDVERATIYLNTVRDRIDPALLDEAQQKINSFGVARQAAQSRERQQIEQARKEYKRKISNQFFAQAAEGNLTPAMVLESDLEALGPGGKQEWLKIIEGGLTGPQKTNPAVYNELFRRANLDEDDPDKIRDADAINQYMPQLGFAAVQQLRGEIDGKNSPEGKARTELRKSMFSTTKKQITGSNDLTGIRDPRGEALYQHALADMLEEETRQLKAGELDIDSYDPTHPKFIGRVATQFKRTPAQMLRDMRDGASAPSPNTTAALPLVRSKEDLEKLAPGTRFMGPDGKIRVKR